MCAQAASLAPCPFGCRYACYKFAERGRAPARRPRGVVAAAGGCGAAHPRTRPPLLATALQPSPGPTPGCQSAKRGTDAAAATRTAWQAPSSPTAALPCIASPPTQHPDELASGALRWAVRRSAGARGGRRPPGARARGGVRVRAGPPARDGFRGWGWCRRRERRKAKARVRGAAPKAPGARDRGGAPAGAAAAQRRPPGDGGRGSHNSASPPHGSQRRRGRSPQTRPRRGKELGAAPGTARPLDGGARAPPPRQLQSPQCPP
jgi:hypothetical protein